MPPKAGGAVYQGKVEDSEDDCSSGNSNILCIICHTVFWSRNHLYQYECLNTTNNKSYLVSQELLSCCSLSTLHGDLKTALPTHQI